MLAGFLGHPAAEASGLEGNSREGEKIQAADDMFAILTSMKEQKAPLMHGF
jgi:hypothetical protein